jgi:hypothetical protein
MKGKKMAFNFDAFRKLVSRAPASAAPQRSDVDSAIAGASAEIARASSEIERLDLGRHEVLVHGSDEDLEAHDTLVVAEMRAKDRAEAMKGKLTGILAEIDAAARLGEMERLRGDAERAHREAVAALKKYPALAAQIVGVLAAVARADAAAQNFAAEYPDEQPIGDAETAARRGPAQPGSWTPARLDASVFLPGFLASDAPIYDARNRADLLTHAPDSDEKIARRVA